MLRKFFRFCLWWLCLFLSVAILSSVAFWGGYWVLKFITAGETITMPSLLGMFEKDAIVTLVNAGLTVQPPIERQPHDEYEQGMVIQQSPRPGVTIKAGRAVRLVVSAGASRKEIPSVVNMTIADAKLRLSASELDIGHIGSIYNALIPAGQIVAQDPTEGQHLHFGHNISVLTSLGPEPPAFIMPNLIDQDYSFSLRELVALGFDVEQPPQYEETDDLEEVGKVLDSDPRAGERITTEDMITLTVGATGRITQSAYNHHLKERVFAQSYSRTFKIVIVDDLCLVDDQGTRIPREMTMTVQPGRNFIDSWLVLAGQAYLEIQLVEPGQEGETHIVARRIIEPETISPLEPGD